jgi:hypothetical protein
MNEWTVPVSSTTDDVFSSLISNRSAAFRSGVVPLFHMLSVMSDDAHRNLPGAERFGLHVAMFIGPCTAVMMVMMASHFTGKVVVQSGRSISYPFS